MNLRTRRELICAVTATQDHLPAKDQFPPFGIALGSLFLGLVLAAVAVFLYQVGIPYDPGKDIVTLSDAKVERAYARCSKGGCWLIFDVESAGRHLELVQHDTPEARSTANALRPGDTVTALASQASITPGSNFLLWELRRNGEELLSYEQTTKDELARNRRNRASSFVVGGFSVVLVLIGVVVGIRQGVWRTGA